MAIGHFLAGVGALIWDPANDEYLLLRRSAQKDYAAEMWECVTGRVDQGESYEQALRREVREEIGAEVQIEFIIATTHFYRGAEKPENELLGVLYGCTLQSSGEIRFGEEHSEMHWVSPAQALAELPQDYWLHKLILRAEKLKATLPAPLRQTFQEQGFEL